MRRCIPASCWLPPILGSIFNDTHLSFDRPDCCHLYLNPTLQVRRERKMEATLAKLRKLCIELGADDAELAASVHPSLRNYHQAMRGHYFGYSASKPTAESEPQAQIALSEEIFRGLESRLNDLTALKEQQEARLADMHEVLQNMWRLLDISEDDDSRSFFQKMIAAPARLHAHTLEKVRSPTRLRYCSNTMVRALGAQHLTVACSAMKKLVALKRNRPRQ